MKIGDRDIYLSTLKSNGMNHRVATTITPSKIPFSTSPLVLLLHGWPESWYSWRHQLKHLSENGFVACAPDMRGYGGTEKPTEDITNYDVHTLAADVVGIANALGYDRFILVGHDFGAWLAWHVALLHPKSVRALCALSVPYVGHGPMGLLTALRKRHGDSLNGSKEEKLRSTFHYMLYHNLKHAAQQYNANAREALYRLYAFSPGVEIEQGTPEVTDKRMFPFATNAATATNNLQLDKANTNDTQKADGGDNHLLLDARSAPGFWQRMPRPKRLPPWLTPQDFEYFITQFTRLGGFAGGLVWYQALDYNWGVTKHLAGKKVDQPVLFIAGDQDMVIHGHGGCSKVRRALMKNCSDIRKCIFLEGSGHWIQQEMADIVNNELLVFLSSLEQSCGKNDLPQLQSRL